MDTEKFERLMTSLEKIADRPTPETDIIECYGAGGLVSCKAPQACNEECYRYQAVMLKPTEHWGHHFFKTQNQDRYLDRIKMLEQKGIIRN